MSTKRKNIPKSLKRTVWNDSCGDSFTGSCYCCGIDIDYENCEFGHIKSVKHGGKNTRENLKPICRTCNRSMGAMNMNTFIKKNGFNKSICVIL